jgi:prevent-host-death family protein
MNVQLCTRWRMKTVSFTEFRKNASTFVDLVERGEQVEIQRHGKIVALLIPADMKAEPSWKRPGLKLVTRAASLSKVIIEDRRFRVR